MYILNVDEQRAVAAAGNLVITQKISTEGMSDVCVKTLVQAIQDFSAGVVSGDEADTRVSLVCTEEEHDIFFGRYNSVLPSKVEFI